VSISTRFITWDLSTSDLTRDVNPGIDGIMQQLVLSSDNKWAAAYTSNNQIVLLNMLSSEFVIIDNPFEPYHDVSGVYLLNYSLFIYSKLKWARYDMRGTLEEQVDVLPNNDENWEILCKFLLDGIDGNSKFMGFIFFGSSHGIYIFNRTLGFILVREYKRY
jgi:NACHT domain- and WD repeat-containing protein